MRRLKTPLISIALILIFLVPIASDAEEQPKSLVFSQVLENPANKLVKRVIQHIYKRIGIQVSFNRMPARRALQSSIKGITDGEVLRIYEIGEIYSSLKRVPTPIFTFRGHAYTINGDQFNNWAVLQNKRVGIVRGVVWAENSISGPNVVLVDNVNHLLDKLLKGGIDVAIAVDFSVVNELSKRKNYPAVSRGEPLIEIEAFHYLHEKHQHLVDIVDKELQKLKKSGELTTLLKAEVDP